MEINVCTPLKEYWSEFDVNELRVVEDLIWSNHHCQISVGVENSCKKITIYVPSKILCQNYHQTIAMLKTITGDNHHRRFTA
jgi:hypothetical protein